MAGYERLKRELIKEGKVLAYYHDTMRIPNGNTAIWDYIHHNGAAAVVPVLEDGRILMVRQFRNAVDREILEIPAGCLNPGEDSRTCAVRELEEETGYRAGRVEHLLDLHTTPGYSDERIGIYCAFDLKPASQKLDEDEFVSLETWTLSGLIERIYEGAITDAKTIAALLAFQCRHN